MKRRSFLQLLATALGLGAVARRVAAEESACCNAPYQTSVVRQEDLCNRATAFGREEAGRMSAEIVRRREADGNIYWNYPGSWKLNPATHHWENTFVFGPEVRNMAVKKAGSSMVE